jgi:RNA polymerase sigma-54 factor
MKTIRGEDVSTLEIKKILRISLKKKIRKPPTRRSSRNLKEERDTPLLRRTIAKYREQLDIPVARMRKKIEF